MKPNAASVMMLRLSVISWERMPSTEGPMSRPPIRKAVTLGMWTSLIKRLTSRPARIAMESASRVVIADWPPILPQTGREPQT